jgi:hypothetical protein
MDHEPDTEVFVYDTPEIRARHPELVDLLNTPLGPDPDDSALSRYLMAAVIVCPKDRRPDLISYLVAKCLSEEPEESRFGMVDVLMKVAEVHD